MIIQADTLELDRCPHCGIARPLLAWQGGEFATTDSAGQRKRFWRAYSCSGCGGVVTTSRRDGQGKVVSDLFPEPRTIDENLPERPRAYLEQAFGSLSQPAGAVMLAASSVDAMLKEKGYKDGSLYSRIDKAAKGHLITEEMAKWAHDVRLDANDQRHADESVPLPDQEAAQRSAEFAHALAEALFILPARVKKGREKLKEN